MSDRATQRKGDIALTQAVAKFTTIGYDVSLPITESAPYDMIVDTGANLIRVQVKYTSRDEIDLRKIHSNAQGYVVKKSKEAEYDWLFVYHEDGSSYLIEECLSDRSTISTSKMIPMDSWQSGRMH